MPKYGSYTKVQWLHKTVKQNQSYSADPSTDKGENSARQDVTPKTTGSSMLLKHNQKLTKNYNQPCEQETVTGPQITLAQSFSASIQTGVKLKY